MDCIEEQQCTDDIVEQKCEHVTVNAKPSINDILCKCIVNSIEPVPIIHYPYLPFFFFFETVTSTVSKNVTQGFSSWTNNLNKEVEFHH